MPDRDRATARPRDRCALGRPGAAALRGGLVGATVVVLAIAAHGGAGGGYPGTPGCALLLSIAAAAGSVAALLPDREGLPHRIAVPAALGGGQLAAHLALTSAATHGGHHMSCDGGAFVPHYPGGWMAAAHALATAACALLIVTAERFYRVVSRTVHALTSRPGPPPGIRSVFLRDTTGAPPRRLCAGAVGPRAPPAFA
ncbi:MAG: hypothetical protein J2P18_11945 [Nocardia sp.]|nr:hypothetical protein [Nocardia sp.]